jgi:hypothetical protein
VPFDDVRLALDDLHILRRQPVMHWKDGAEARIQLAFEIRTIEQSIAHEPELRTAEQVSERTGRPGDTNIEASLRRL